MAGKAVGIDLGTTKSCVAVVYEGEPHVIPDDEGMATVPSYVSFRGGQVTVGRRARQDAIDAPADVVYAAKRLIGRAADAPETVKAAETCSYQVLRGQDGEVVIKAGSAT